MKRLDLHMILCKILNCPEIGKDCRVYFQPPSNVVLKYPCVVYNLSDIPISHADDRSYIVDKEYLLTLMDKNPESLYLDSILEISKIEFDRSYKSDNINHWVFSVY